MAELRVGFIGTGRPWKTEGATGFGMCYAHAEGYRALPDVKLAACADLVAENARAFASRTGTAGTYTDYRRMLAEEKLDVVSICTWPSLHEEMTVAACEAGVKVVHCEKPIADTWGAARRMAAAAAKHGTRLSFNHQRRFGGVFLKVKEIRDAGTLGALKRMECTPPNLFDWGTHWVDMMQMFNREAPATWVLAALDYRRGSSVFAVPHEDQAVATIRYQNGVQGFMLCRVMEGAPALTFVGDEGRLEVGSWNQTPLKLTTARGEEAPEVAETKDGHVGRAVAEVVNAFRENRPCELSVDNAIKGTEILFAAYESARRRARVDLPLEIDDHPLASMLAAGELKPSS